MDGQTATADGQKTQEVRLSGRSIAPGLGMGRAWVIGDVLSYNGVQPTVGPDEVAHESDRLRQAFEETFSELELSAKRIESEFDSALAGIFRAHGTMLRGLVDSGEFENELKNSSLAAETAVRRVLNRWYKKFKALENQTLRQRADDVLDLGRNIIRRLRGDTSGELDVRIGFTIPDKSSAWLPMPFKAVTNRLSDD